MEKLCDFCGEVYVDTPINVKKANQRIDRYKVEPDKIKTNSDKLGQGAFGVVQLGRYFDVNGDEKEVAVKTTTIDLDEKREIANLTRELYVMFILNHVNLMHAYAYSQETGSTKTVVKIAMELKTCSLHDILFPKNYVFDKKPIYLTATNKTRHQFMKIAIMGIAHGIKALHDNDIVHSDLKPGNILVQIENGILTDVKISDFGLSDGTNAIGIGTTPDYENPITEIEVMYTDAFTTMEKEDDIHSFGVILFNLLTARHCYWFSRSGSKNSNYGIFKTRDEFLELVTQTVVMENVNKRRDLEQFVRQKWALDKDVNYIEPTELEKYGVVAEELMLDGMSQISFYWFMWVIITGCCRLKGRWDIDTVLSRLELLFKLFPSS